ncbi:MAG: hypothetical protein WCE27_10465, partial [Pseudolabrys sp.]
DKPGREKRREKRPCDDEKGIEIGSSSGWKSHAPGKDGYGGKSHNNDPHAEPTSPAGGSA